MQSNPTITAKQYLSTLKRGREKKSKYNNTSTEYRGVKYHSKLEAGYAARLDALRGAKSIQNRVVDVKTQVPFKITSKGGHLVFTYLLDFEVTYADGRVELVEVKGMMTRVGQMKINAVEKEYKVKIKIVKEL